jgi:hypothetical protein
MHRERAASRSEEAAGPEGTGRSMRLAVGSVGGGGDTELTRLLARENDRPVSQEPIAGV